MARLGADLQVSPQELMTDSSIQLAQLGAMATTGDGRRFRYVKCGATALVPGKLYQPAAETTAWQDLDIAAAATGDKSITTTSTITATVNQLAGGYVCITNGTGAGYYYRISGNTAASSAVCTIYLEDPIATTTAVTVDVDIIMSPFAETTLYIAGSTSGIPLGVAVYPVTAEYYGWLQVGGPATVLVDASNLTVGGDVYGSDDTDGAVGAYEADVVGNRAIVGAALTASTSTEYGMVYLKIS